MIKMEILMQRIYKIVTLTLAVIFSTALGYYYDAACNCGEKKCPPAGNKVVAVTQIVPHKAIDAIRMGIAESLKTHGYIPGKNLIWIYKNADGNPATGSQIAKDFTSMNPAPHAIVAITTLSTQLVMSANRESNVPIVFAGVSDPVSAKIITGLKDPHPHVTGITDAPLVAEQLSLIKSLISPKKGEKLKIGIVYNPGEANSSFQVAEAQRIAAEMGIILEVRSADNTSKVISAVQNLISDIHALYIPLDNTVVSSLPNVIKTALTARIPVFGSDEVQVSMGAVATYGYDPFEIGINAGNKVAAILNGTNPKDIAIEDPDNPKLIINKKQLQNYGIKISPELEKKYCIKNAPIFKSS